ncbi:MAG: macro domain-containing protein [Candidatus Limnocylindrales bacterium]
METGFGATGRINLVIGDITLLPADAIVNAANAYLAGGSGVDGAIHRAGGPTIMADLVERYGAVRRCEPGDAVVTTAGLLPARWVIHAVGPIWRGGDAGEAGTLASAYRRSTELARDLGASTISFPAISTGVYGYPMDLAAAVAVAAVSDALRRSPSLSATFVLRDRSAAGHFVRAIRPRLAAESEQAERDP